MVSRRVKNQMYNIAERVLNKRAETKYVDTAVAASLAATFATSATTISLTTVAQGQTDTSRLGDELTPMGLHCSVTLSAASAGDLSITASLCRFIIVQYLEDDTAVTADRTLLAAEVLQQPGEIDSFYRHDQGNLYRILYDSHATPIAIGDAVGTNEIPSGGIPSIKHWEFTIPLYEKSARETIEFSGAGTTGEGKIYIMAAQGVAVTNYQAAIAFKTRFTFKDY